MNYKEELLWILDNPEGFGKTLEAQNKTIKINTDFVHSLGLKCDCVGWSKLDLSNPRTPEILDAISNFCKQNGWKVRGYYSRTFVDVESEWYELVPTFFNIDNIVEYNDILSANNVKISTFSIRACNEMRPIPKEKWKILVPERVRDFFIKNKMTELEFCWVEDKGKYEAEQYFFTYANTLIPKIATNYGIKKANNKKLIKQAGGWLPYISTFLHKFEQINLEYCYLQKNMPKCKICYAHRSDPNSGTLVNRLLLHKSIVQNLLDNKIIPASSLKPAPIFKKLPGGYTLEKTHELERPNKEYINMMLDKYQKIKNNPRPIKKISEKDALKVLRFAKKERNEDFNKPLTKKIKDNLENTMYNVMIPYYSVSNGCYLSDEYELFSYEESIKEDKIFKENIKKEELINFNLSGFVIGKCPDGDIIILCDNNNVLRFSHEEPVVLQEWISLSQFIVDAVND